jgi:hypothetical protein
MIGNGCGRGIIPANLRQRGERYIELIARLQVVKSMSESAELIQFAQRIQGHIVFSGDGRRGLAGVKGMGAGLHHRAALLPQKLALTVRAGDCGRKRDRQGTSCLDNDAEPGK